MNGDRRSSSVVDWDVASSTARALLRRSSALDDEIQRQVEEEFVVATRRAEELVSEVTGLHSRSGHARAVTVSRSQWVDANLASFQRMLRPMLDSSTTSGWARALRTTAVGQQVSGAEVGALLAWLSSRVLGQYDIVPGTPEGNDAIYYVAPNIVSVERRHGFAPGDFRLWIAVHEVTHRMQFTGVEWMEEHFLDLLERATAITVDPSSMIDGARRVITAVRAGENPLGESGLIGLVASSEQLGTVREIQAFMSLLEGHADVVMSAVGDDVIPGATRFAKVLSERRQNVRGGAKLLQQLLGIEAKLRQYRDGEHFVETVIAAEGVRGFSRVWERPEHLPTLDEIHDPHIWLARVVGSVTPTS